MNIFFFLSIFIYFLLNNNDKKKSKIELTLANNKFPREITAIALHTSFFIHKNTVHNKNTKTNREYILVNSQQLYCS